MDIVIEKLEQEARKIEVEARRNGMLKTDKFSRELNRSSYEDYLDWLEGEGRQH